MMLLSRFAATVFWAGMLVIAVRDAYAQSYPTKPVRIVTAAAGGNADFSARLIAQGVSGLLGQQVVVDNRGGAGGIIAVETVAKSPPDGYSVLLYSSGMWTSPLMVTSVSYDPIKDFAPITIAVASPQILVVHPSLPVHSVKDLITLAKASPGTLNYGTSGVGSANHLQGELFKAMAGVNIVHVAYKAQALSTSDLVAGQLQVMFSAAAAVMPHVKSGRLRALAVTSVRPSALFPELPTVAATGVPGYEAVSVFGMFAPAGTPTTIIRRLNQDIVRVLNQPDVKEKFSNNGAEIVGSSPEQLAATVKADITRLGKVIRDAGIREE